MNKLTKKGVPRKSNAGRPALFNEDTKELRRLVPISQFDKIEKIVDKELQKIKKNGK